MKKLFTLFYLLIVSLVAFGAEVTYNFTSKELPNGWTGTAGANYEAGDTGRGTQWTSNAKLTLKGAKNVSKVVITCSCNVADKNTMGVSVNGTTWGTETLAKENNVDKTFTGTTASGDIVISLTREEKSIYIKKIVVYGDVEGGNEGEGESTTLDPNYTYAEPTVVTTTATTGTFNQSYSFIQNNIKVDCTTGANTPATESISTAYFGCNAGQSITFTASKEIKGILINGLIKKDFTAEVSSGELYSVDASESEVENDPVVAIFDINSKTITINCAKQMRCYSVEFYFDENPEIGVDDDDDEGDYNFDYEPAETINTEIAFDEMKYIDYDEYYGTEGEANYIECIFESDDWGLDLGVNTTRDAATIIPVGTYEVSDSGELGTVEVSPGGDDMYDYSSCFTTDYVYDEDYGWYYNTAYYVASGTLIVEKVAEGVKMTLNCKTAKGSTIKATYTGKPANYLAEDEDAISTVKSNSKNEGKFVEDGRIVIRKDGKTYGTMGIRLKK